MLLAGLIDNITKCTSVTTKPFECMMSGMVLQCLPLVIHLCFCEHVLLEEALDLANIHQYAWVIFIEIVRQGHDHQKRFLTNKLSESGSFLQQFSLILGHNRIRPRPETG